jgi:nucleotide-binding universal stress UspA family protein
MRSAIGRIRLEKILYATDFSSVSTVALPYAAGLARWFEAKLHLVHIATPGLYVLGPPGAIPKAVEREKAAAKVQMEQLIARPELSHLEHEVIIEPGDLPSRLAELAHERGIDLIVIGASDLSGYRRWLRRPISTDVMQASPCPVLTVPSQACSVPFRAFQRILCSVDSSQESACAFKYALAWAQEFEAALTTVHVLDDKLPRSPAIDSTRARLEALISPEDRSRYRPEVSIRFGDQAQGILEAASDTGADLVVMGVLDRNEGIWTRSTAESVLASTSFPMLTVTSRFSARQLAPAA